MINTEFSGLSLAPSCLDKKTQDYFDIKRASWLRKGSSLSICACATHPMYRRIKIENRIIQEILTIHPPTKDQRLAILSIGSGGLKQDYLLFKKLKKMGYDKFDLVTVDPLIKPSDITKFQSLLVGIDLRILPLSKIKNLNEALRLMPEKNRISPLFHYIYAIDFDLVCENTKKAWKILNLSKNILAPSGMIFCSASLSTYTFNIPSGWNFKLKSTTENFTKAMNVGEEIADKLSSPSKINCLVLSNFHDTLGLVSSFVKKGIIDISFSFLYDNADKTGLNAAMDKEKEELAQQIFPQAKITFTSTDQVKENYAFNAVINTRRAVINDKNLSQNGLQLQTRLKDTPFCGVTYL